MNTYQATHQSACPNGKLMDTYQITIRSMSTIMVEAIADAIKSAPNPVYQEDLATHLRTTLGAEVIVQGWHHGIFVTCHRK